MVPGGLRDCSHTINPFQNACSICIVRLASSPPLTHPGANEGPSGQPIVLLLDQPTAGPPVREVMVHYSVSRACHRAASDGRAERDEAGVGRGSPFRQGGGRGCGAARNRVTRGFGGSGGATNGAWALGQLRSPEPTEEAHAGAAVWRAVSLPHRPSAWECLLPRRPPTPRPPMPSSPRARKAGARSRSRRPCRPCRPCRPAWPGSPPQAWAPRRSRPRRW